MSEQHPDPEQEMYACPRDAVLHHICAAAWSNESSGSVDSPQGAFARVSNKMNEIIDLESAFSDVMNEHGVPITDIVGHFLVVVKADEQVKVTEYPTEDDVYRAFHDLDGEWLIGRSKRN